MSDCIERMTFDFKGKPYEVKIYHDDFHDSMEDAIGDLFEICYRGNLALGTVEKRKSEFARELAYIEDNYEGKALAARMKELKATWFYAPVYAYVHGSATIGLHPYNCRFDSGMSGYVYAKWATLLKDFGQKRKTKAFLTRARKAMESFVDAARQYVEGRIYGYIIKSGEEEIDSCWGILGERWVRESIFEALRGEGSTRPELDALRTNLELKPLTDKEWRETLAARRRVAKLVQATTEHFKEGA